MEYAFSPVSLKRPSASFYAGTAESLMFLADSGFRLNGNNDNVHVFTYNKITYLWPFEGDHEKSSLKLSFIESLCKNNEMSKQLDCSDFSVLSFCPSQRLYLCYKNIPDKPINQAYAFTFPIERFFPPEIGQAAHSLASDCWSKLKLRP